MQKLVNQYLLFFLTMIFLVGSTEVFAQAVLNIVPELTTANLNLTGIATITFTVTNNTKHPIGQLTIDPTCYVSHNIMFNTSNHPAIF
jgi:hypothetical protein